MSKPIILLKPACFAVSAAPTIPPAGPDTMQSLPANRLASVRPPDERMNINLVLPSFDDTCLTYFFRIGDR